MIGAIIGDIVGSRFERNNHRSKEFELFTPECRATDDSIMTLAVARAIMEAQKYIEAGAEPMSDSYLELLSNLTVKSMQSLGRKYPNCGFGGRFIYWIFSLSPQPYYSFGNGSAMRISPVGNIAPTEAEVIAWSNAVTRVTHNHPEGLKGAEATALAIFMARQGASKEEIRSRITQGYYPLDFTMDGIRSSYQFDVTCQNSVPQAIQAFLESASFEDAIRLAISVGGDSDTLAAIAGGIAEAYYGVPEPLRQNALSYLDEELRGIYDDWMAFMGGERRN